MAWDSQQPDAFFGLVRHVVRKVSVGRFRQVVGSRVSAGKPGGLTAGRCGRYR